MRRIAAIIMSALVLGVVAPALPAAADTEGWKLSCTYKVKPHKVSGHCKGHTHLGKVHGSFHGSLQPSRVASGKFMLRSSTGKMDGRFRGSGFDGGKASGRFTVKLGSTVIFGSFVARPG